MSSVDGKAAMALGGIEGRRRIAWLNLAFNYTNLAVAFATGVLLVPAYLRSFSLATYGAWLASGNVLGMVGVLDAGVNLVLSQQLAAHAARGDRAGFAQAAAAGLGLVLTSGMLVALVGLAISGWVPGWVHCPAEDAGALRWGIALAALGSGASMVAQGLGGVLQAWEAPRAAGLATIAASLLGLVGTIAGLALGLGVASLACGIAVRGLAGMVLAGVAVLAGWRRERLPSPRLQPRLAVALLRTSAPVFASRLGSTLLANSESLVLAVLASPTVAGVVALTGRIYSFAALLLAPIGSSAYAGIARLAATDPGPRLRMVLGELFAIVGVGSGFLLGGAVALNPGFLQLWVGAGIFGGLALNAALAVAVAITARTSLAGLTLTALGRPSGAAWTALVEAVVRVPLMVALVRWLGAIGIPMATIMTGLVVSTALYPLLFRRAVGPQGGGVLAAGIPALVAAIAAGIAAAATWRATTWPRWVGEGVIVAAGLAVILVGSSRRARASFLNAASRLRPDQGRAT